MYYKGTALQCYLLLVRGLPEVDKREDEGEEDDDERAEQERYHRPLRLGLLSVQFIAMCAF